MFYAQAKRLVDRPTNCLLTRRLAQLSERIVIGFVPSTLYGALPDVIRAFREAQPDVELSLIEMFTLEQLGALKGGRIDVGFGRLRFDDDQLVREALIEEKLIAALPVGHPLADPARPLTLADIANETLIVYPSTPRPSFADQQPRRCATARWCRRPFTRCASCRRRSARGRAGRRVAGAGERGGRAREGRGLPAVAGAGRDVADHHEPPAARAATPRFARLRGR